LFRSSGKSFWSRLFLGLEFKFLLLLKFWFDQLFIIAVLRRLSIMAIDEIDDVLPDQDAAKEFYAKYEPKEVLGRWVG